MTRQSHIEAVARKLRLGRGCEAGEVPCPFCHWTAPDDPSGDFSEVGCIYLATAAIAELERLGAYVGEGWVAVPSEPTNDMLDAGLEEDTWSPLEIYLAMIAAKPKPAQGKE